MFHSASACLNFWITITPDPGYVVVYLGWDDVM